jgi:hypothetical protein
MTQPKKQFTNDRGETINPEHRLVTDPTTGGIWSSYINETMPRSLFQKVGLIDADGSAEWFNVVEHSALVAAFARKIATDLQARGVDVSAPIAERAAWVHDATKRRDVMEAMRREDETSDTMLDRLLTDAGYADAEISAARNTGRVADRFIEDADERMAAIKARTVEENIVGYADARTRGAQLMSLDGAKRDSIAMKPGETDFFERAWYPYYKDVEAYFSSIAPGYDVEAVDVQAVAASIS